MPWAQVRLLDLLHHNPVTCSGRKTAPTTPPTPSSDSETRVTNLILHLLPVCNTSLVSPLGSLTIEMSLTMPNGSSTVLSGTTLESTQFSIATYSNLLSTSPTARVMLTAKLKVLAMLEKILPSHLQVQQSIDVFVIWATVYDIMDISACPRPTDSYEADQKYDKLVISGIFALAQPEPIRSSVEGTCPNNVECRKTDINFSPASVYTYDGPSPGTSVTFRFPNLRLTVTKFARTDPSGIVTFQSFQVETPGTHILRTSFNHDQPRCLVSSEFFQRVVNVTRICNAHSEATTDDDMTCLQMSSHFRSLHHPDDV